MGRRRILSSAAANGLLGASHTSAAAEAAAFSGSDLPDLREEEVWASAYAGSSSGGRSWRLWGGGGDHRHHVGGLSLAFDAASEAAVARRQRGPGRAAAAASAPVSVPQWGRMGLGRVDGSAAAEEEEEDEEGWVPPHEYLARGQGKAPPAASVFEGVGRTLKGRDMSRVRDAVWSRTGFFG
ncbi:hypothetical protein AXF42_Ash019699 [Apostasia shenzhenica]|uniref:Uncharacterized protein n=1 Tax=Apostasia shenzhenica TaxID=1088818 RepID=A0A2H9ZTU9_9ASPA|nr:hypothetical protein AXF42_Ash019699 [Apostasia shenzhenica]